MTRSWWENEEILQRFRDWLLQTGEEVAALRGADPDARRLGDDGGYVDERTWPVDPESFDEPRPEFEVHDPSDEPAPELLSVGLVDLIEAFTALRHETKLQTKGSRGLDESVQAALQGLERAARQFETVQSREQEAADRAVQPFAEALANLDEALGRGALAIAASHQQATHAVPEQLRRSLEQRFQQLSWWRRRRARRWHEQVQAACQQEISAAMNATLNRLMEGYDLIHARLRRVMQEQGVARIECVGNVVDPSRMNVVELVDDATAAAGTVVEEVRPGYTYHDKVIRFAEVRAARRPDALPPCDPPPSMAEFTNNEAI